MKVRFLKLQNWLLLSLLGFLGVSSCHSNRHLSEPKPKQRDTIQDQEITPLYGVPSVRYERQSDADVQDPVSPREPQVALYGVPTVNFNVRGKVLDKKGKAIQGLQVTLVNSDIDPTNLPQTDEWIRRLASVTDTTNNDGSFDITTSDRPWETPSVLIRDIDGKKNGFYPETIISVVPNEFEEKNNTQGVSQWDLGTKSAEITIHLDGFEK